MIKVQEAENQIIVAYQVYDKRPADSALLIPAIEQHQQRLGVVPRMATADAGFFSAANETAAQKMGVVRVAVPYLGTHSAQRRKRQKERWFRRAQKWRIGCEGRISVVKHRHGLRRCLYKGDAGMHRWVGLGTASANCTGAQIAFRMGGDPPSISSATRPALPSFEGAPNSRH